MWGCNQHLCWYALLGYWTGGNSDDRPVYGGWANGARPKGSKNQLVMNVSVTFVAVIGIQLFAEPLILLFGSTSPEVISDGIYYLRICCGINSLIYAAMYTLDSFAIGVGAANVAMINALLDAVIVRLPVSWILAFTLHMGFSGIYYGQALSPILPAIVGVLYFISKSGNEKRSFNQATREKGFDGWDGFYA